METYFLKRTNKYFFVSGAVIEGLMIWGSKCHKNNSPVVSDGYVKYEEAEVDRLVAVYLYATTCVIRLLVINLKIFKNH